MLTEKYNVALFFLFIGWYVEIVFIFSDPDVPPTKEYDTNTIDQSSDEDKQSPDILTLDSESTDCNEVDGKISGCASQSKLTLYTSEYLHIIVAVASLAGLFVGFLCGYLVSRRFHSHPQYPNSPFIEQHNHLDR